MQKSISDSSNGISLIVAPRKSPESQVATFTTRVHSDRELLLAVDVVAGGELLLTADVVVAPATEARSVRIQRI